MTVPSDKAQIGECSAFRPSARLSALELADRSPLLGFLPSMNRDEAHLGHRFGRGSSRLRVGRAGVDVEHDLGERVELRPDAFELGVGEVIALGGHHGPHLAQGKHERFLSASVRLQPGDAGVRRVWWYVAWLIA